MTRTKWLKTAAFLLLTAAISVLFGSAASAFNENEDNVRYTNPKNGYKVYIIDEIDLLSESEEVTLVKEMVPITDFGNIIYWSTDAYTPNELIQAREKRYAICGNSSSGIFEINMRVKKVTIQSDGKIYDYISPSYARSITDNVSGYASSEKYYDCASAAFDQMHSVLLGNRIAEPMKYTSIIVIGLMLSFVVVVGIVFSKAFNPLIKHKHKAIRVENGEYVKGDASFRLIDVRLRAWVIALKAFAIFMLHLLKEILLSFFRGGGSRKSDYRDSGFSSGSGRSSRGGGGGGSSRF